MNQNFSTYLIDDYYISEPCFVGHKPNYRYPVEIIVRTALEFYAPKVKKYYLNIPKFDIKQGIWSDGEQEEGQVPDDIDKFVKKICTELFAEEKNRVYFELYLYDENPSDSRFSWSLGDFIHIRTNPTEFEVFRSHLVKNELPNDLYYLGGTEVIAYPPAKSLLNTIRRLIGWKKGYTPKQWLEANK
jgi:hypothetical protein